MPIMSNTRGHRIHQIVRRGHREFEIIRVRGGMGGSFRVNLYRPGDQKWHTLGTFSTRAGARATIRAYVKRYVTRKRAA